MQHNLIWLVVLFLIATPLGMLLAVLLDREMRGHAVLPDGDLPAGRAVPGAVGFIWQLIYSRDQGLLNAVTGSTIDWYGDPSVNLWAALVAATLAARRLRHAALPGRAQGRRPVAARGGQDRRRERAPTFFRVVFPVMRPINIIVLVITVIESLRAFDLVWVINKGRNGLELISTLVTQNVVGEASRIGFGSALATIMLLISTRAHRHLPAHRR